MSNNSAPVGYDSNDLPVGLHLLGDNWQEDKLLRLANAIERGFLERRAPREHFADVLAKWLGKSE